MRTNSDKEIVLKEINIPVIKLHALDIDRYFKDNYITITANTNSVTLHIINLNNNPAHIYQVKANTPTRILLEEKKITNLYSFIKGQTNITAIDLSELSLDGVQSFAETFYGCTNLTSIIFPKKRIVNSNWRETFYNNNKLKALDLSMIDFSGNYSNATSNFNSMFARCTALTDLKMGYNVQTRIDFSVSPLTHDSALSVINSLSKVQSTQTVIFKKTTYATLTNDEIAIATSKGWNVAQY